MRSTLSSASLALLLACGQADPDTPPAVNAARVLLAEAGFPGGKGFPRLTLSYNRADVHQRLAAAVQEMWRRNLGVEVSLENMEFRVFQEKVQKGEFDIARRAWIGEYADPHAFLDLFTRDSHANPTGWSSDAYERLVGESLSELDPARRLQLLDDAERLLLDDAPVAPLYHYVAHNYIKTFVKGVHHNTRDMHPLQHVWLEGPGAPADGVLVFNASEEPGSLDPAVSRDMGGLKTLMNLFEGLANYHPETGAPVPAAAERWEASPDGKTWTFTLREAKWSNGDPVTAHDFVYAWRRVVDPKTGSNYSHRMYLLKNARKIVAGTMKPETLGVRAEGDRTLVATLEHVAPWFPELLCLNLFFPVHRPTVERHGEKWTLPGNTVHNGPYRLVSWTLNDRKVFEASPLYRAAKDVKLRKFVFVSITDDAAALRAWQAGQVHWLFRAPLEFVDQLKTMPEYRVGPYNGVYLYAFNLRKKPLDDVRVRKALSMAIDREKIATYILKGGEQPATQLVPPTSRPK